MIGGQTSYFTKRCRKLEAAELGTNLYLQVEEKRLFPQWFEDGKDGPVGYMMGWGTQEDFFCFELTQWLF